MLLVLLSCVLSDDAEPLPERDIHRIAVGSWSLSDGAVLSQGTDGLELNHDGEHHILAAAVLGEPAISEDGTRLVFAHRDDGMTLSALDAITLTRAGLTRRRLVSDGSPDRAAITGDGQWVAYVSGQTGIASVWVVPFDGGIPEQLTNVGLQDAPRQSGAPPDGFIPPPHADPLRIDGGQVVWRSREGEHAVDLP
ncbi:MAG: hypothetical protein ACI8RZ_007380 [Myxococcota bacterium]|jgi:hypothetical protein